MTIIDTIAQYAQTGAALWLAIRIEGLLRSLTQRVERIENRVGLVPQETEVLH